MTMSPSKRVQRVERELFETLSNYLIHGLGRPLPCFVSITAVEVNSTLRHAKVFFRLIGQGADVARTQEILSEERVGFQQEIARQLKSKFCPVLRFEFGVAEKKDEIDALFEKLRAPKHQFGD